MVRIPETMFHDSEIMCLELHMIPISVFHYTKKTALLQGEFVKKGSCLFLWVFRQGQTHGETRAFSHFAFHGNLAAAALQDLLYDRKAKTVSLLGMGRETG